MQCERPRELLSPYLDRELSAEERQVVTAHIEGCRTCSAQAADFRRIGRTLAEAGREPAPKALALRVRANLAREAEGAEGRIASSPVKPAPGRPSSGLRAFMRQAAVVAAACVLS